VTAPVKFKLGHYSELLTSSGSQQNRVAAMTHNVRGTTPSRLAQMNDEFLLAPSGMERPHSISQFSTLTFSHFSCEGRSAFC
jgi:hypothetical protein